MSSSLADKLIAPALVLMAACAGNAVGAEVRGTVNVDYEGLFQRGNEADKYPVSVALQPADGQRSPQPGTGRNTIEIVANRMQPAFLTVQRGTTIEFVNRDDVFHELFTLSAGTPERTQLGKAGNRQHDRASFTLDRPGTVHFFCRIHNKGYARIDVVDTPYIQTVQPGAEFSFKGLRPGPWRLRVAAPAAETEWVDVTAVTSPPPLKLSLKSRSGGSGGTSGTGGNANVGRLYRSVAATGAAP